MEAAGLALFMISAGLFGTLADFGKWAKPAGIADVILFLASDAAPRGERGRRPRVRQGLSRRRRRLLWYLELFQEGVT
jgi:hypothetical protein